MPRRFITISGDNNFQAFTSTFTRRVRDFSSSFKRSNRRRFSSRFERKTRR